MSKNGQQGQQQSKKKEATTAPSQNASSASESSQSPASETIKQIESQIKQIDRQLGKFDAQLMRMDHGIAALQEISTQKSAQLLVQVTDGIFINATVDNTKDIILAVGADVAVQKDLNATILLLQQQKELSLQYQQKLIEKMESLSYQADELMQKESEARKWKSE